MLFCLLISCSSSNSSGQEESKDSWQSLFNGETLEGWDTYIGANDLGLNNDPNKVFTVAEIDGEPALRISGQQFAGISTTQEFENFHLQLQFKWGELKWPPRENAKRDSGLLYFAGGKHGVDANAWMRSQEFQVQEGDTGDYWGVAGGAFEIPVRKDGENYVFDPSGELMPFSTISEFGRHAVKNPDGEKPTGEWNTIDLYCFGSTAVHMINGKVVMVLYNSSVVQGDELVPLSKGKIQIQSEGAEVFYRNIKVENISALPKGIISL
ncbi:MAG: DUF1080 domain-containing protein [Cytophagia bacterium]|nr:DUF1080 domain-containing protein [Cytophagia bacterium]